MADEGCFLPGEPTVFLPLTQQSQGSTGKANAFGSSSFHFNPKEFATAYAELERLDNFLVAARKLLPIKRCERLLARILGQ